MLLMKINEKYKSVIINNAMFLKKKPLKLSLFDFCCTLHLTVFSMCDFNHLSSNLKPSWRTVCIWNV